MKCISPCSEMFKCEKRNDDKELCEDSCAQLALYRTYLDKFENYRMSDGDVTYYNLPLAPPGEEGHVEDPYSSLLALETIYHNKMEAAEAVVDEAIDASFSQPLYNSYFKEGAENEFTH